MSPSRWKHPPRRIPANVIMHLCKWTFPTEMRVPPSILSMDLRVLKARSRLTE
jgi:hypothetical protein